MNRPTLQLNRLNVKSVFANCRSYQSADTPTTGDPFTVEIKGVSRTFAFDSRLLPYEEKNILELLDQLPSSFEHGDSFAMLRQNRAGECWTADDTSSPEVLMALGMAIGKIVRVVEHGRPLLKIV